MFTYPIGFMSGGVADFPVVENDVQFYQGGSSSFNVTLPSGIVAGELLMITVVGYNASVAGNMNLPAGWSRAYTTLVSDDIRFVETIFKIADGLEGATLNIATTATMGMATRSYRISGAGGEVEGTSIEQLGNGTVPNSPSFSPTWGSKKNLWFASTGIFSGIISQVSPSGYTNFDQLASGGALDRPRIASAEKQVETATENPPPFGAGMSGVVAVCQAVTVAVKPKF